MSGPYGGVWKFVTKNDLSDATRSTGKIHKVISRVNGDIAPLDADGCGLLQTCVRSGNQAAYQYDGVAKFTAGAAITNSDTMLTSVASGYVVVANSGDFMIGRSLEAVNSGSLGKGLFDFKNPVLAVDCSYLHN